MPWVKFHRTFLWNPPQYGRRVSIAHEAGKTYFVKQSVADEAVNRLFGEIVEREPAKTAPKGRSRKKD